MEEENERKYEDRPEREKKEMKRDEREKRNELARPTFYSDVLEYKCFS